MECAICKREHTNNGVAAFYQIGTVEGFIKYFCGPDCKGYFEVQMNIIFHDFCEVEMDTQYEVCT